MVINFLIRKPFLFISLTKSIMSNPNLELRHITLSYASALGEVPVIKGIDFKAFSGETIGLVGSSGVGKTSLMMIAAGLTIPTSGEVFVAGQSLRDRSEAELTQLRAQHVGIVFQNFHLIDSMTALENVMIPLEFAGVPDARLKAETQLAEVGLDKRMNHYPVQLSGGEQQRVALARAVVRAPSLLLADEPTGNLDQDNGKLILDVLFRLVERHQTTLMLITHDPSIAAACSRTAKMVDGRMET